MTNPNLFAIVPVKPFSVCKSRLASLLTVSERERLGQFLLSRTLDIVANTVGETNVIVVSRDERALGLARQAGVHALLESGSTDMNGAVAQAARWAQTISAASLVVVPTDLPLLTVNRLRQFIDTADADEAEIAIVPDRHEIGTNLLLLHPVLADVFRFGAESLNAYRMLSEHRRLAFRIYRYGDLALDIDTPADFNLWQSRGSTPALINTMGALTS